MLVVIYQINYRILPIIYHFFMTIYSGFDSVLPLKQKKQKRNFSPKIFCEMLFIPVKQNSYRNIRLSGYNVLPKGHFLPSEILTTKSDIGLLMTQAKQSLSVGI